MKNLTFFNPMMAFLFTAVFSLKNIKQTSKKCCMPILQVSYIKQNEESDASDIFQKQIFICTNKWCKEKGSGSTLSSFVGLTPDEVSIRGVNCLGRCNKGPNLRIQQENGTWLEFNGVNSVQMVYKILTQVLEVEVNEIAALCLKLNFEGNSHLEKNEVDEAIKCYDKALKLNWKEQEGVLLVMRATAYLQRAYIHKKHVTSLLKKLTKEMPSLQNFETAFKISSSNLPGALILLDWLSNYCDEKDALYKYCKFTFGLYQLALMKAYKDSMDAIELLPDYAKCWLRVGDALAELRRFEEAADYYKVAIDLDKQLKESLEPTIAWMRSFPHKSESTVVN
mmetsp:Transcript_20735/g.30685  ORF Transcript_20735/g.30685 Transcript_20735/m.30685 type:complete len:338 (-) Transcript_20735:3-1016(-)